MTQVDFYILNSTNQGHLERFTCKLAEKAYKKGHSIHILTADSQQTERLDKLLWVYDEKSFIPHVVSGDKLADKTPIHIGSEIDKVSLFDVLINLQSTLPTKIAEFERIAEIVSGDSQQRQAARTRYREYQQQDCKVVTHEVNG